jgi:hypothetical protein
VGRPASRRWVSPKSLGGTEFVWGFQQMCSRPPNGWAQPHASADLVAGGLHARAAPIRALEARAPHQNGPRAGASPKTPRGRLTPESAARAGASPNRAPRRRLSPKFRCLRGRLSPESAARAGVSYQTSSARAGASHQNPSPARAPYLKPRGPRCQLPAVLAGERLKRAHRCGPYSYSGLGAATTRYLTCRLQALPRNGRSALKVIYIKYLDNAASK